MFTLEIRTENSAFYTTFAEDQEDRFTPEAELARILRVIAYKLEQGHESGKCADPNGNTVGEWELSAP